MHSPEIGGRRPRRIVVVSDFCDGSRPMVEQRSIAECRASWLAGERGPALSTNPAPAAQALVLGGYLERLPLTALRVGLCDVAEIWSFRTHEMPVAFPDIDVTARWLQRRSFHCDANARPYSSNDMLGYIEAFGPPDILCVLGLGVDAAILDACSSSIKIYYSIDAPALRIPADISARFDIVLTGAAWQSEQVKTRHPDMLTAIMPIGPEFASPETFFQTGADKIYDMIYVAAAQPYKRHDVLFEALAKLPRSTRALCVIGYGELGDALRLRARGIGIDVEFIGPPGVGFAEVNRLMNLARVGVVCGVDDGAPAILTEYMLAGLPVLANAGLRCGLQYILPETGRVATEERFHEGLATMLGELESYSARAVAMDRWSWRATAPRFAQLVAIAKAVKASSRLEH